MLNSAGFVDYVLMGWSRDLFMDTRLHDVSTLETPVQPAFATPVCIFRRAWSTFVPSLLDVVVWTSKAEARQKQGRASKNKTEEGLCLPTWRTSCSPLSVGLTTTTVSPSCLTATRRNKKARDSALCSTSTLLSKSLSKRTTSSAAWRRVDKKLKILKFSKRRRGIIILLFSVEV